MADHHQMLVEQRTFSTPPKVTLILLAYNQSAYVEQAVSAALAQDYYPLEIVLSDDASPDDTFAIMKRLARSYSGPNTVRVRQSARNVGLTTHLQQAVKEASGDLIIVSAGDDVSLPQRVTSMVRHWDSIGRGTVLMYSDIEMMNINGDIINQPSWVYTGKHDLTGIAGGFSEAIGASSAFTRDLIEAFPGFVDGLIYEDRVLGWRSLLLGGSIEYVPEKTIRYRVAGGISRHHPLHMKDYLTAWSVRRHTHLLEDAVQRLRDADHVGFDNAEVRDLCERTIATHRALIELSASRSLARERVLLKHLRLNIDRRLVLRHYLKSRTRWIIQGKTNRAFRQNMLDAS
jgi:cellulose synthase/poly-beta-1,6-N-acetylglucosamine synthase-like glycosyltransferase